MNIVDSMKNGARRLPFHPQWLLGRREVAAVVRTLRGTVLDVGCANRWVESYLSSESWYVGLDYPPTACALYSSRADVFGDASRLPFSCSSIDAIVCLEVLEHLREYRSALDEFSRVLKPQGVLVLSLPFMYPIHDAPHDYQRLTEHGLRRDLEAAGFEISSLKKVGHSVRTAGLLFNLSLVGGLYARRRLTDYLLLPFVATLVSIINLTSLALSWFLPDWRALGFGYEVEATRT